jgi:hypothetical protein
MSESEPTWAAPAEAEPVKSGYEAGFDDNPFAAGKEVNVKRNGKNGVPDYHEGGWKIVNDDASVRVGQDKYMVGVVVEKEVDGEIFQKSIPLNELMDLNPRVDKEPTVDHATAEKVGGEVLEVVGVDEVDDSIDENAHNYSSSDIRAMREAAERVMEKPTPTDPSDVLRKLTEGLSADDLLELRSYAEATDEVRDAQKEDRGQDSTYWQQIKGQSLRAMSPRAQEVANRYAGYYTQTK